MRYATFSPASDPRPRPGIVEGDRVVELQAASLLDVIRHGAAGVARGASHALTDVLLHAPIPRPLKNVFCVGRNYAAHVREGAAAYNREVKLPDVPQFFTKAPTAVNGPFDDVPLHAAATQQLDWEAELAVVIGRAGRDIGSRDARSHVFGYTVLNDVTARDLQQRHGQ